MAPAGIAKTAAWLKSKKRLREVTNERFEIFSIFHQSRESISLISNLLYIFRSRFGESTVVDAILLNKRKKSNINNE